MKPPSDPQLTNYRESMLYRAFIYNFETDMGSIKSVTRFVYIFCPSSLKLKGESICETKTHDEKL